MCVCISPCAHAVKSGQHPAVSLIKLQACRHTDSQISILFHLHIVAHVLLNGQLRLIIWMWINSNNALFYSGTIKCFTLTPHPEHLSSSEGNYWRIYRSPGAPLIISQLAYLCVPHHSLLHRWKVTDSISVSRFALCTSVHVEPKPVLQMDTGSQSWPATFVTVCSLTLTAGWNNYLSQPWGVIPVI